MAQKTENYKYKAGIVGNMVDKDFNKSLDKYLSKRRSFNSSINISDIRAKLRPKFEKIKIKPKFSKTKAEFINHDDKIEKREKKCLLSKILKAFKPKKKEVNLVDEDMNPVSAEIDFEVKQGEEVGEFEKELDAIEDIEKKEKNMLGFMRELINKMKFSKSLSDKEKEYLEEDVEVHEAMEDDVKDDLRTVLDFSIELLKIIPSKDFKWLKEKDSFQSYKKIVKKYMKTSKDNQE